MKPKLFILLSMLTVLICGNLYAQTEKGQFLIGDLYRFNITGYGSITQTNIGFGTNTYKSDNSEDGSSEKFLTLNLIPKAGYFFADNLAVGLEMSLLYFRSKEEGYKNRMNMYGAGPFIRYYIPMERIMPFFELSGSFGRIRSWTYSEASENEYEDISSIFALGGGVGLAILLNQKLCFDVLAGYNRTVARNIEENNDNWRYITGSFGLKLGFTFTLGSD